MLASPAPVPAGELVVPPVLAEAKDRGRSAFNAVVVALMAEAFLLESRRRAPQDGGTIIHTSRLWPQHITTILSLVLVQNIVTLAVAAVLRIDGGSIRQEKSISDLAGSSNNSRIDLSRQSLPIFFFASVVRGIADSAKGPSASAMIADHTDERHLARAYSWYTTTKSTSGSIGETLAVWLDSVSPGDLYRQSDGNGRVAVIPT